MKVFDSIKRALRKGDPLPDGFYAFTFWTTTYSGRRVKIGVPAGMTVSEFEDQMHERYWSPNVEELKD